MIGSSMVQVPMSHQEEDGQSLVAAKRPLNCARRVCAYGTKQTLAVF